MAQPRPNETSARPSPPRRPIPGWAFSNSYAALPERFWARLDPRPVADPRLIELNAPLAAQLGLDLQGLDAPTLASIFSGNCIPEGAEPVAMAYAGHQFGQFVPQLGDGRAILMGEVIDRSGARRDIQLKGTGRTPFSRSGDGRAALGPVLREYLLSEAMHRLGVATTRALAAVATGEAVLRTTRLPGAVLTRVAASHVRVGTFEYFAARGDRDALQRLADYVIDRHYPELKLAERPYLELLREVSLRQASLVASWLHIGFIHGVMNTDNTSIAGETIDFGPCAFMDSYDPATVFSSIDSLGRYAYGNQPMAAQWNLARLAETLLPLIDADAQRAVDAAAPLVESFQGHLEARWLEGMRRKLGLASREEADLALARSLLEAMRREGCDFTATFRHLSAAAGGSGCVEACPQLGDWCAGWRARLERDPQSIEERVRAMRQVNPAYIPRNHRVEAALEAAVERADFAPFRELLQVLAHPYEDQPGKDAFAAPPLPGERVLQTFCGT